MPATREYWPLVLENLKSKISGSNYKAWFSRLEFVSTGNQGRKIVLGVPSVFNKNYIESKYKHDLLEAISKYYPQVIHVDYEVQKNPVMEEEMEEIVPTSTPSSTTGHTTVEEEEKPKASYLPRKNLNYLNPKYNFDNFVVTRNNELATSVANSIVRQPGTLYNPVFIYGGVGLGKTHLLQAIGHKTLELQPSFNIKYIPCETFVSQFLFAVQKRRMDEFKEYYNDIDLLLLDDIQFIAGKEATQEAFFHTFNTLHQLNKQIVLTSDRVPQSLGGIEERLVSRFGWGMVVDISKPDLEDRIAVLRDKAQRFELQISEDHIRYIAERLDTNIRELEGVLNKIKARLTLSPNTQLSLDLINTTIAPHTKNTETFIHSGNITNPDSILQAVCKVFALSKADILGSSRSKNIALARQITMWFYKHELDLSYPVIGKMFGGRDHTTIMHGSNKVEKLRKEDKKIADKITLVKEMLSK